MNNGWGPQRILGEGKQVTGVEFKRCMSVFHETGRFNPEYDESQIMRIEARGDASSTCGHHDYQEDPDCTGPHGYAGGEAFAFSAMVTRRFTSAAKAIEDSEVCSLPVEKITKILEKDYKAGFYFMKQIAVIVSSRLIKIHYRMDVTGSGYI